MESSNILKRQELLDLLSKYQGLVKKYEQVQNQLMDIEEQQDFTKQQISTLLNSVLDEDVLQIVDYEGQVEEIQVYLVVNHLLIYNRDRSRPTIILLEKKGSIDQLSSIGEIKP